MSDINKILYILLTVLAIFCSACFADEYKQNSAEFIQKDDVAIQLQNDYKLEHSVIFEAINKLTKTLVAYDKRANRINKYGLASIGIAFTSAAAAAMAIFLNEKKQINLIPEFYMDNFLVPTLAMGVFGGAVSGILDDILFKSEKEVILKQLKFIGDLLIEECHTAQGYYFFSAEIQQKLINFLKESRIAIKNPVYREPIEVLINLSVRYKKY